MESFTVAEDEELCQTINREELDITLPTSRYRRPRSTRRFIDVWRLPRRTSLVDEERTEAGGGAAPQSRGPPKTPKELLDDLPDGMPKTATFLSLDPDLSTLIVRRFHQLSTRNLLFLEGRVAALQKLQRNLDQTQKENRDVIDADKSWEEFALLGTGRGARGDIDIPSIALAEWSISRKTRKTGNLAGEKIEPWQQAKAIRFVRNLLQSIEEPGVEDRDTILHAVQLELQTLRDNLVLKPEAEFSPQAKGLDVTMSCLENSKPRLTWMQREVSKNGDFAIISDIVQSLLLAIQDSLTMKGSEVSGQATSLSFVKNILETAQDKIFSQLPEIFELHAGLLSIAIESLSTIHASEPTDDADFSHQAKLLSVAKDLLERIQERFRDSPNYSPQANDLRAVKNLLQNVQDNLYAIDTDLARRAKSFDLAETSLRTIQDKWDVALALKDALKEYRKGRKTHPKQKWLLTLDRRSCSSLP